MENGKRIGLGEKLNQIRDGIRLSRMANMLKKPTEDVLKICFPKGIGNNIIADLSQSIEFDHGALLVVTSVDFVKDWLEKNNFGELVIFPSMIVSKRLGNRYLGEGNEIQTTIVKAQESSGRKLEIFIPNLTDVELANKIVKKDIKMEFERHFAFMPKADIDDEGLTKLANTITENGFKSDDGGINKKEGTTTLYFTREGKDGKPMRMELICKGTFQQALERHQKMVI